MSQSGILADLTSPSGDVETLTADDTNVVSPVANNINIFSDDSTTNNENGITTTGSGDTVSILLTNRLQGTIQTVGAVTEDLITFPLGATPGNYTFEVRISGHESTTPGGLGYSLFGSITTTGAAGSIQGTVDRINNENPALTGANATIIASGNNAIVQVTGVADLTINWAAVGLYTFVS